PSALDRLPQEVVGVVGSGGELSLKVAQDQTIRTIKPNEEYRDGWMLKTLTPSTATLTRAGESREVGLNPFGSLTPPPAANDPSKVLIAGDTIEDRDALDRSFIAEYWRSKGIDPNAPGLSFNLNDFRQVLGPDRFAAFEANDTRLGELRVARARTEALARGDLNTVRALDHQPVAGPDSFMVLPGVDPEQAAQAAGLPSTMGYSWDARADNRQGTRWIKCYTPTTPESAIDC
ncbi:MAG: hypothetical protein JWM33_3698, partial [Caulobacteraceae bacterium]|nr:hypothetical protein [Caulobacteraceae bacterium]